MKINSIQLKYAGVSGDLFKMLPPVGDIWKGAKEKFEFMTAKVPNIKSIVIDQVIRHHFQMHKHNWPLLVAMFAVVSTHNSPNHLKIFKTTVMSIFPFIFAPHRTPI